MRIGSPFIAPRPRSRRWPGRCAGRLPGGGDHSRDGASRLARAPCRGTRPDPRFASTSAVVPAGWVLTSWHRCRSRRSVSLSPRGRAASRRALSCTSGRSRTASTRLARTPGVRCPAVARNDTRAVRSDSCGTVTSAEATVPWLSLISTCRCRSCSPMLGPLRWDSWRGRWGGGPGLARPDRDLPAPAIGAEMRIRRSAWPPAGPTPRSPTPKPPRHQPAARRRCRRSVSALAHDRPGGGDDRL